MISTFNPSKIKEIKQKYKDVVIGFVKKIQTELSDHNIPSEIIDLVLLFWF